MSVRRGSALLLAAVSGGATAKDRDPAPAALEVPADGRVEVTVDGRPATALVTPGMPSDVYLSRRFARAIVGPDADRFNAGSGGFALLSIGRGTGARIGPVRVKGQHRTVAFGIGGTATRTRASWFETDGYPFADVLAGPHALPAPVIRFRLRAAAADEVVATLPLAGRHSWWLATTRRTVDGKPVQFAFAPQFARTVASAAAGAAIVREQGGRFAGPAERVRISHGVDRPARPVPLARPLAFGAMRVERMMVRVADYGSAASIADPALAADPSEAGEDVVVKGKRRSRPSYVVYLGADSLERCSSVTFDKPARTITLSCRP